MKKTQTHRDVRENSAATAALFRKVSTATGLALLATATTQGSTDYGPAIWRPTCEANWYSTGYGHKFHVVHDMEGYYASVISWFTSCGMTSASVHFAVNGLKDASSDYAAGEITQMISEAYYAWHACCWNQHSTGTEHEGFASNPAWYTTQQYQASAGISAHVASKFGYAKDRNHIVGHNEKSSAAWVNYANANLGISATCNTHSDPGPYWDWNYYMTLVNPPPPPSLSPNPSIANNKDGRMEIFAIGSNGALWHMWETSNNGPWSSWSSFGGSGITQIAAGRHNDGRLECFVVAGNALSSQYQAGTPLAWYGFQQFPGASVTSIATANNADGRLEVFAIGTDNALWHIWETSNSGPWSSWARMGGGGITQIATGRHQDGRLEVFVVAGNVMSSQFQSGTPLTWNGFQQFPGCSVTTVATANNADGRLEVFAIGTDGALWHIWETSNNGPWSAWQKMGGSSITQIAPGRHLDGRLEVFVVAANAVSSMYQAGSPLAWYGFQQLGGSLTSLAVGNHNDGRVEMFGRWTNAKMYQMAETTPNGAWSAWNNYSANTFK